MKRFGLFEVNADVAVVVDLCEDCHGGDCAVLLLSLNILSLDRRLNGRVYPE